MENMNENTFGERIKRLRIERNLTQKELAIATGISLRTIEDYEQIIYKAPTADTLLILASYFDMAPAILLYGGNDSMNNTMNVYEKAITEELKQINKREVIIQIHKVPFNGSILSKLSLTEALISEIKDKWEPLFKEETGDYKKIGRGIYRNYVRDVILKYCQNRSRFIDELGLTNGMYILHKLNVIAE